MPQAPQMVSPLTSSFPVSSPFTSEISKLTRADAPTTFATSTRPISASDREAAAESASQNAAPPSPHMPFGAGSPIHRLQDFSAPGVERSLANSAEAPEKQKWWHVWV